MLICSEERKPAGWDVNVLLTFHPLQLPEGKPAIVKKKKEKKNVKNKHLRFKAFLFLLWFNKLSVKRQIKLAISSITNSVTYAELMDLVTVDTK